MDSRRSITDFEPVPEDAAEPHVAARPHPENPEIETPADVVEFLAEDAPLQLMTADEAPTFEAVQAMAASDASEGASRRCAWLTGGRTRDDPYVLNWSGTPDSTWDYVTLVWDMWVNGVTYSVRGDGLLSSAWQWVSRGNSHETSWTRDAFEAKRCANPQALYVVWDGRRNEYVAENPCR